jgi:thiamine-phosphate pyrophosphorylase
MRSGRTTRNGLSLPVVCPITDTDLASPLSHGEIGRRLARGGATMFQVREKRLPDARLAMEIRECVEIGGALVIVNDRPDLALAAGAAGVHLGADDLPVPEARELMGPGAIIGLSTNSAEAAVAACRLDLDYVALGPIFETSTKPGRGAPLGVEAVAAAAPGMTRPLVAIGGIRLGEARRLLDAGADCIAVISDIMSAERIEDRVRSYLDLAREGR